jgi:hypothetical protein
VTVCPGSPKIRSQLIPDVDVDKDGQKELSLGLGFTAVGAVIK